MYKVFIDGAHGTTGLKIHEHLSKRDDIEIVQISEELRKDLNERVRLATESDLTIMCLPDAASKELANALPKEARVIDTSTAHRTDPGWTYGMAELCKGQRDAIKNSNRVANPGCHATGFIMLVKPLVAEGVIDADYPLDCFCVTGYSGGGKKMIERHESEGRDDFLCSPGQYALTQNHKHLPEMKVMTGISEEPCFSPIVGDFYSGMVMTIPLHRKLMGNNLSLDEVRKVYKEYYKGETLVHVMDGDPEDGFIHSNICSGKNYIEIFVSGNEERPLIISRFDNLGKGASGAAIQNLNIMLGADETKGLL